MTIDRFRNEKVLDTTNGKVNPSQRSSKLGPRASQIEVAVANWYISDRTRASWLDQVGKIEGHELTREVPNLDEVEIDNSIADPAGCQLDHNRPIRVINFNAERGKNWAEFATMVQTMPDLERPDFIILNEMDIGMARSENFHTTRMLAYELSMNYAWGLEFIELTRGTEAEQIATAGMTDSLGLHGNAILSTCKLYDPLIIRDKLSPIFYSNRTSWENAHGFEKRLGGRMAMFVRAGPVEGGTGRHMIAGSVHKVRFSHRKRMYEYFGIGDVPTRAPDVASYETRLDEGINVKNVGPSNLIGIIVAGDVDRNFCPQYGLQNPDLINESGIKHTFRSDCSKGSPGTRRGDFFCANMDVYGEDKVFAPCYTAEHSNTTVQISDHAIMVISLTGN